MLVHTSSQGVHECASIAEIPCSAQHFRAAKVALSQCMLRKISIWAGFIALMYAYTCRHDRAYVCLYVQAWSCSCVHIRPGMIAPMRVYTWRHNNMNSYQMCTCSRLCIHTKYGSDYFYLYVCLLLWSLLCVHMCVGMIRLSWACMCEHIELNCTYTCEHHRVYE